MDPSDRFLALLAVAPDHVLGRLARAKLVRDPVERFTLLTSLFEEVPYRAEVMAEYAQAFWQSSNTFEIAAMKKLADRLDGAAESFQADAFMRHYATHCLFIRAEILGGLGRYDEALEDSLAAERAQQGAVADLEKLVAFYRNTAKLLLVTGREAEGLRRFDHALRYRPGDAHVHAIRGQFRLARGAAHAARLDLEVARDALPAGHSQEAEIALALLVAATEDGASDVAAASADRFAGLLPSAGLLTCPFEIPELGARADPRSGPGAARARRRGAARPRRALRAQTSQGRPRQQ